MKCPVFVPRPTWALCSSHKSRRSSLHRGLLPWPRHGVAVPPSVPTSELFPQHPPKPLQEVHPLFTPQGYVRLSQIMPDPDSSASLHIRVPSSTPTAPGLPGFQTTDQNEHGKEALHAALRTFHSNVWGVCESSGLSQSSILL